MSDFPRLKVSGLGWDTPGELIEFEQARYFPFSPDLIITVDDQVVNSYEEMEKLAEAAICNQKPYLEVVFLPVIVGG